MQPAVSDCSEAEGEFFVHIDEIDALTFLLDHTCQ